MNGFSHKERLEDELLSGCMVCGKQWQRKDVDKYYYFNGTLVCQTHAGAKEFYDGAMKLADEALKHEGI